MNRLFSEIKIKDLELKNRIVMAPIYRVVADDKGYAIDKFYIFY